jgi:hypothetical protein
MEGRGPGRSSRPGRAGRPDKQQHHLARPDQPAPSGVLPKPIYNMARNSSSNTFGTGINESTINGSLTNLIFPFFYLPNVLARHSLNGFTRASA